MTGDFNAMLADMVAGRWTDPETGPGTGRPAPAVPFRDIRLMDTTDGAEADLIAPLGLGRDLAVVSDPRTHAAMGARVARALSAIATVRDVVIDPDEATDEAVAMVQDRTRGATGLVAVGSGTLQDLVKHATFQDGRPFATFATAASMNGYTSTTASITRGGMKLSLKSHTPRGLFMDVGVIAAAPAFLARAGLGDCLCRTTAQVDWRLSARLFGTPYHETPFLMQAADEPLMLAQAAAIGRGEPAAIATLLRVLTLVGLATCFTGTSHHGSMSEHLVSHWIDMFAGDSHPGTLHGHQVGYAAVAMSRLHHAILDADAPPVLRPMVVDAAEVLGRYGARLGPPVLAEFRAKAATAQDAGHLNAILADWDAFRAPLRAVMLPTAVLEAALADCGGYASAAASGLPGPVWRDALLHAREVRNRYSILDVAADSGNLAAFADAEGARP
jgi:glycerol-1-phosphate dehydrogenase [NAD(P)+]